MFIVLLCSAVLVITPIFVVQYQRFLASLPTLKLHGPLPPQTDPQIPSNHGEASFDGPASDNISKGPSNLRPIRAATTSGYGSQETRKPWDPPFPTKPRSMRDPYRVLLRSDEEQRIEKREELKKGRSISPMSPDREEGVPNNGHAIITDNLPSRRASIDSSAERQAVLASRPTSPKASTQSTPELAHPTNRRGSTFSALQVIVLALASIVFVFAFAILVAHCMAWLVVHKTEARLGDVRRGLLRSGDMRVCLCAR